MGAVSRSRGLRTSAAVSVLLAGVVSGCASHPPRAEERAPVHTVQDTTVSQDGATLFLPAGSVDRDTTARVARATETPPGGAPVAGYDFDLAGAKVIAPVRITLPVTEPKAAPDGTMLVPYLSNGKWGTEVGHYDPASHTVSVTVNHLSWYGDFAALAYQVLRKTLGEWLGKFRASPPKCSGGPGIRYPLDSIGEPPVLACDSGDQNGGTLTVANNRGFYLMVNPQRGLTIHDVKVNGVLDKATSGGGAVIRYLAKWNSLPLPPTATATFTYQAVNGGPALSFRPDPAATFVAAILTQFSGISDQGAVLLRALDCARGVLNDNQEGWAGCVADAVAEEANKALDSAHQTLTFAGLPVARSMLGALSVFLRAIPALDMAIESRDGGSESTIQIDATPPTSRPGTPPNANPATPVPGGAAVPAPPTAPQPPRPGVNRFAVASYDQLREGLPHAEWFQAWQDFTAQTNTLTRLSINVGDTRWAPGPINQSATLRLCRDAGCSQQLGSWSTQIANYATTTVDIGDFPVQPGATYFLRFDRPDNAHTWAVYFQGPGTYNNLSATVLGYNR